MKLKTGFTLIELLIVVAIIGILAAIAVPNFLNAQMRAKVARAESDLKAVSTAVEMYTLDHNSPPPNTNVSIGDPTNGYIRYNLTTPVAYLSSGLLVDPFVRANDPDQAAQDELYYTYHNIIQYGWPENILKHYGMWRACSYGPDQTYFNGAYGARCYDPSNGLISNGNIWISQKGFIHSMPEGI